MNVPCKRVYFMDLDPDNDLVHDLDREPDHFVPFKRSRYGTRLMDI